MPRARPSLTSLSLTLLLLSGCSGGESEEAQVMQAERVILITCDTLRADRLGAYGFPGQTSPMLDRFARQAVVYDKAYAAASMTMPAFSSMMTGLLPDHTGVGDNRKLIPAEATTIAEALRSSGFATAAVVSNFVLRSRQAGKDVGMQQGFDHFDDTMNSAERTRTEVKERLAPDTTDAALAWLEARTTDRFFLWVHYQDPHGPYTPPKRFIQPAVRPGAKRLPLSNTSNTTGNIPFYQVLRRNGNTDFYQNRYEAEIRFFDQELGRLLEALEAEDLVSDALVIFTSDHGESLGEHDWWFSHGQSLYNELVQVPLIVRYPSEPAADHIRWEGDFRRSEALVGHVDLISTVLNSVGLEASETHGKSLLDRSLAGPRVMLQSVRKPGDKGRWKSVTDGRWRWLKSADEELLFDLDNDPGELTNRLSEEPGLAQQLQSRYGEELGRIPALGARATKIQLNAEEETDLKLLGYGGEEED